MNAPLSSPNRSPLQEISSRHRLLAILRVLDKRVAYAANDILAKYGLGGSAEQLRSDFSELEGIGAIELSRFEDVLVATLTEHGQDIANGTVISEIVLRPGPECKY